MTDLNERLRGIDRLATPDLWEAAQARASAEVLVPAVSPGRRFAIIAASLAIGLAAVAGVVIALVPAMSPPTPADAPILSPAPRADCPTAPVGADSVGTQKFVREMQGYLPTWLPEGFGLLATYGWDGAMDGSAGHGIWSDDRCREVELAFNPNWVSSGNVPPGDLRPSVGPWIVEADEPSECGNAVFGEGRCLRYSASTTDGLLTLAMIGLDREEGDRVALSIHDQPAPIIPPLSGSIAFFEGQQAFGPITLLDVASGSVEQLTHPFNSVSLAWSPDGSTIAMTRAILEGNGELVLVSASTGRIVRTMPIDPLLNPQAADWAPDGNSLAFTDTYARLHIIRSDGSDLRDVPTEGLRALDIAWSPSGDAIAFVGDKGDLAVVDVRTGETEIVFEDPPGERVWFGPAWSPDGESLAFSLATDAGSTVNVIRRDGTGLLRLTEEGVLDALNPTWSPDGNWIAFQAGDDQDDLFAVTVNGSKVVQLTHSPRDEYAPDWGG